MCGVHGPASDLELRVLGSTLGHCMYVVSLARHLIHIAVVKLGHAPVLDRAYTGNLYHGE